MPVTKSAKKKLRKDKKRQKINIVFKNLLKTLIKKAKKTPTDKTVTDAIKTLDKGVKRGILHKNKAARIKSKLAELLNKKAAKKRKLQSSSNSSKK